MALLPQSQNTNRKSTYGNMFVLAIPRDSRDVQTAFTIMSELVSPEVQTAFAQRLNMASARNDVLNASDTQNKYRAIIDRSAIMAKGVLEPDEQQTTEIIRDLILQVESGQFEISEAIQYANQKLVRLVNQIQER